tara:strand:+ start:15139 stop:16014 length:876 start_codon:yes stop_codon:yes gene_type:complete
LKWIDYASPNSIKEAVALLSNKNTVARAMAGGTDLIVQLRAAPERIGNPDVVVDIKNIPELNEINLDSKGLTLGSAVPMYKIYNNESITASYPALQDSTSLVGGIQIQGRASVGGNLCNSAPSGDTIPTLIALNATCKVDGPNGSRDLKVEDFCTGPGKSVLENGEILISIHIPAPSKGSGSSYLRFIPRNEMDIAVVGVGTSISLDGDIVKSVKVALASVGPTPILVSDAEKIIGKSIEDEDTLKIAGEAAKNAATPITDMRGTIEFRKHLCDVLTRRTLKIATERARGN